MVVKTFRSDLGECGTEKGETWLFTSRTLFADGVLRRRMRRQLVQQKTDPVLQKSYIQSVSAKKTYPSLPLQQTCRQYF